MLIFERIELVSKLRFEGKLFLWIPSRSNSRFLFYFENVRIGVGNQPSDFPENLDFTAFDKENAIRLLALPEQNFGRVHLPVARARNHSENELLVCFGEKRKVLIKSEDGVEMVDVVLPNQNIVGVLRDDH